MTHISRQHNQSTSGYCTVHRKKKMFPLYLFNFTSTKSALLLYLPQNVHPGVTESRSQNYKLQQNRERKKVFNKRRTPTASIRASVEMLILQPLSNSTQPRPPHLRQPTGILLVDKWKECLLRWVEGWVCTFGEPCNDEMTTVCLCKHATWWSKSNSGTIWRGRIFIDV